MLTKLKLPKHPATGMVALLARLSVRPRRRKYRPQHHGPRGFWGKRPEDLLEMLESARSGFRALAKQHRTDLAANHEAAISLITTWKTVKRRFAEHGYTLL